MTGTFSFRRFVALASLFLTFAIVTAPRAMATHLRGESLTWQPVANQPNTVQFTFLYSQRWSYPGSPGTCGTAQQVAGACPTVGSAINLITSSGTGTFNFGDGSTGSPDGTVTSINEADDYFFGTFTFTHKYPTCDTYTAYFYATNRVSTLVLGHDQPEYISTTVNPCNANGAPV